jgi:phosphate transport system substrate-binding protein
MTKLRGRAFRFLLVAMTVMLIAAACGDDDDNGGSGENASADEELSGAIAVSGSSTVEPISVAVAEKFSATQPAVDISVSGPGTSDGFELFCNGETDISDASRAIEQEEIDACAENGIDFIELYIAIDGLSVITSTENDFVTCVNHADLWSLLGPEAEGFGQWSDANGLAEEYGGVAAPYPDQPLVITAPGEESGTFDAFVELVLEAFVEEAGLEEEYEEVSTRPDYQASANDNVIIEGIQGTASSLGWVGYAFFVSNQESVAALEVDGGDGCVAPTPETIASFEYPISRPLFIYVNTAKLEENPATEAYVDFYLSDEGITSAEEVGYVALNDEDLGETRSVWESKETGTRQDS